QPILEKLQTTMSQSGEIFFSLGCIKALHSEFEKSAEFFRKAIIIDPELSQDSDNFHKRLGDEFLAFAGYFKTQANRRPSVTYMVKKGLRFAPNHSHLLYELEEIIEEDIKLSQSSPDVGNHQDAVQSINSWYNLLEEQKDLTLNLNPEPVSKIYLNHGRLLVKEESYAEAIADFKKGLGFFPENYDLNRSIIDTLFETGDFNGAIEALNRAIAIDSEFAGYWEIIGDSLQADDQHEDAILAYERCFMLLPENLSLLKKIGDCYRATDQLEAAQAAYQQLKAKMEELDTASNGIQ
ncbi:MAG: tetratricopeptide repeat protein, partial [Desulfobulbaceae bacterium]|nr:tetratricopeptide repeat protein [Desulfobulbaceae bacterium]